MEITTKKAIQEILAKKPNELTISDRQELENEYIESQNIQNNLKQQLEQFILNETIYISIKDQNHTSYLQLTIFNEEEDQQGYRLHKGTYQKIFLPPANIDKLIQILTTYKNQYIPQQNHTQKIYRKTNEYYY